MLAHVIRGREISDSPFSKHRARNVANLDMGPNSEGPGPAAMIRALAPVAVRRSQIERFLEPGVAADVLRRTKGSVDSVASGIARYIASCDIVGIDYSPPTSYRLRQWSSISKPGKTFGMYIAFKESAPNPQRTDFSARRCIIERDPRFTERAGAGRFR